MNDFFSSNLSATRMFLLFQCLLLLGCRVTLADIDLGDGSDTKANVGVYYNFGSFTPGSRFEKNRNIVIDFLINGSESYSYGSDPDKVFGFRRCFFNTTQNLCTDCLKRNWKQINNTSPYTYGARCWVNNTVLQSCYLRYENYQFLNVSSPTAPPPAPESLLSPTSAPLNKTTGSSSSSKVGIYVGVGLGAAAAVILTIISAYFFFFRRPVRKISRSQAYTRDLAMEVRSNDATVFRYETLRAATNGFSKGNELGHGGFGTVYKGILSDGTEVAVKKLALQSRQGQQEFVNEITIITGIQHKNLVRLKGYCIEEERLLVYEFMENGSLDNMLFGLHELAWDTRHAIMIGVARGLAYIHEDSHIQIVHRDIKAGNILLDKKLNPKISDFGISKLFVQDGGYSSTKIAGTLGYLAPEYATRGRLTTKADVFSFGVVILELISGRRCNVETLPPNEQLLLEWVWNLRQGGNVEEAIDKRLLKDDTFSSDEALRAIHIALLCTHEDEGCRPIMSHVVSMLQGLMALAQLPSEPPRYFVQMNVVKRNSSLMTESSTPSVENTLTAR